MFVLVGSFLPQHLTGEHQAHGLDADGEVPWPQSLIGQHRHVGAVCTCEATSASVPDGPGVVTCL